MTTWRRFARFNAVGALGILVQLSTIGALTEWWGIGYLPATVAGVSAAVVHNFFWHLRWTWGDRRLTPVAAAGAFLRFASGNGLVSLIGNVVIMALVTGAGGVAPLPANGVAIAACGLLNFWLGDRLVFVERPTPDPSPELFAPIPSEEP